jgi:protein transport protein SEC61 subunit beta
MARGAAPGQISTNVKPSGGPRGPAGAPAGAIRRRTNGGRGGEVSKKNMLRFYTDESPGLTVSPVLVLSMSLGFVAFVVLLHVIGKLYSLRM